MFITGYDSSLSSSKLVLHQGSSFLCHAQFAGNAEVGLIGCQTLVPVFLTSTVTSPRAAVNCRYEVVIPDELYLL